VARRLLLQPFQTIEDAILGGPGVGEHTRGHLAIHSALLSLERRGQVTSIFRRALEAQLAVGIIAHSHSQHVELGFDCELLLGHVSQLDLHAG
jgi:hypothetical protein